MYKRQPEHLAPFIATGIAFVFERTPAGWQETEALEAQVPDYHLHFGSTVALWGDTALVSDSPGVSGTGDVQVFDRGPNGWEPTALLSSPGTDGFGEALALRGETALVGAPTALVGGVFQGFARAYERGPEGWVAVAELHNPGGGAFHRFGASVALSQESYLAGIPGDADLGPMAGSASLFGRDESLCVFPEQASAFFGGFQGFELAAGLAHAGRPYLILGTVSGTAPGIAVGSLTVPLNPDAYTDLTLQDPAAPIYTGFAGLLDAFGNAAAQVTLPPGSPPALVGLTFHHAFVLFLPQLDFASNPVSWTIGF